MRRTGPDFLRWVSIVLLLAAVALSFFELIAYSQKRSRLPDGLVVAGVPVGGLTDDDARVRLAEVFSTPLELRYNEQIFYLNPASVSFRLDIGAMLAAAELERTGDNFWGGFWDFLWGRQGESSSLPIRAEYSETQLETVLQDIAARYDEPPIPPQPIPGTPNFTAGEPGSVLDIARARDLVGRVLELPTNRQVNLPIVAGAEVNPSFETLELLLKQNIDVAGFRGLAVVYLRDLRTGDEMHFAYLDGDDIETSPDISFSAASTIKIGIMVSFYRYFDEPLDAEAADWLDKMITESGNDPSDWLMQAIDEVRGPLEVTDALQEIGLDNTFIGGYYRLGSPVLFRYTTPSNQRTDINTSPDLYTQTTATDIGMLLADIYACARDGGTLRLVYSNEITPEECQNMLNLLAQNNIGILLEAGVPDGTVVAHKHGWRDSPLDMIGDAGIIYTPGGDYVLSIFLWNQTEMIWDPTSRLVADLSRAVYNYFNPPETPN